MISNRKVYGIIVTYNGMKWIRECLDSIYKSKEKIHIIVIDNCSTDGTLQFIRENYPDVVLISNKKNLGFGQANNLGIEYAYKNGATHFFLINQDVYIEPGTVKKLIDIQTKEKFYILSPIHLNGTGDTIDELFSKHVSKSLNTDEPISNLLTKKKKEYYIVDFVNAAAWMLSRKCIEEIGGFDPIFYIYGEDSNYCQRVKYHGGRIAITPLATIRHDRTIHGNNDVYNKRAVISALLKTYANINEPFFKVTKSRLKFHARMEKNSLKSLLLLKPNDFLKIHKSYSSYIAMIPKVWRSRKLNKTAGANYLNIKNEGKKNG